MAMAAQHTVTLVQTLYDLMNNHQLDPAWLDKSLTFFAEDCEVIDIPSGMTSRGPDGYKQLILFFEEGFPDSGIEITNLFATEDQAVVELSKCASVMCIASGMGRLSIIAATTMGLASCNSLVSFRHRNKPVDGGVEGSKGGKLLCGGVSTSQE